MGKRTFQSDDEELDPRRRWKMCDRKRKYKSSEASYYASKYQFRKYECPLCRGWHLTKRGGRHG